MAMRSRSQTQAFLALLSTIDEPMYGVPRYETVISISADEGLMIG